MMHQSIYVIVPVYNEAMIIRQTILDLAGLGIEIVIVDDGSTDDTEARLQGLPVFYLKHMVNLGQGAALNTGVQFAYQKGAEFFVTFDADGQHDVANIQPMINHLQKSDVSIVFGSRFKEGARTNITKKRKHIIKVARFINYCLSGILLSDAHNGFVAFNRDGAAIYCDLLENRMAHASELVINLKRLKLSYDEYPVNVTYSTYSIEKGQRTRDSIKIIKDLLIYKLFNS